MAAHRRLHAIKGVQRAPAARGRYSYVAPCQARDRAPAAVRDFVVAAHPCERCVRCVRCVPWSLRVPPRPTATAPPPLACAVHPPAACAVPPLRLCRPALHDPPRLYSFSALVALAPRSAKPLARPQGAARSPSHRVHATVCPSCTRRASPSPSPSLHLPVSRRSLALPRPRAPARRDVP
jgi:hypothetical protein